MDLAALLTLVALGAVNTLIRMADIITYGSEAVLENTELEQIFYAKLISLHPSRSRPPRGKREQCRKFFGCQS